MTNLRQLPRSVGGCDAACDVGRIGFLALVNGTRDRREVLVSNRHVLLAGGAVRGDPVYAAGSTDAARAPGAAVRVGEVDDEGQESNHPFAYLGETHDEYFVDCASARLAGRGRSLGWRVVATPDGSEGRRVRGVARIHPLDVVGARRPRVWKLTTELSAIGRVVDVAAAVSGRGGQQRLNNVAIRLDDPAMLEPGDSGALVVNDRREAVAMLWGRSDSDPRTAYACHIHPVLDRLGVTMITQRA